MTGLQTARILAGHGVPVVGVVSDPGHFAARTRVCREIRRSVVGADRLVDDLEAWGPELRGAVLVPCTDLSVALVSRHRDRLEPFYRWAMPDHRVVELLMDKISFARYAAEADLDVPETAVLAERADAERAADELTFPAVVKPPIKAEAWTRHTKAKAIVVAGRDELLDTYDRTRAWAPLLLAQQWIPGGDDCLVSCNAYFDASSTPLVTFVARKVRQWPPETGTSASGVECRDDVVLDATIRLFGGLGYRGLAYLEMKRDPRTGRHFVIEPNIGRPTGRSAIAEAGGVDLLWTMYCDVAGLPLPTRTVQQYGGAKWLDVRRDLQSAMHDWRRGALTPRQWLGSLRGPVFHAIWARDDPWPFFFDVGQAAGKGIRRAASRATTRVRHRRRPAPEGEVD